MKQSLYRHFFDSEYRSEDNGVKKKHGGQYGGPRTPSKGNWRSMYLYCKVCDEWMCPLNESNIWDNPVWEPYLWEHLNRYHEYEMIMVTLRGDEYID